MAEMRGSTWFTAERPEHLQPRVNGDLRRFIAADFRHLAPMVTNNSDGSWRCFAFVADLGLSPSGMLFDEIEQVVVVPESKSLVFLLCSGLIFSEMHGSPEAQRVAGHTFGVPKALIAGESVFRRWPSPRR